MDWGRKVYRITAVKKTEEKELPGNVRGHHEFDKMRLLLLAAAAFCLNLADGFSQNKFEGQTLETACAQLYPFHGGLDPQPGTGNYSLTVVNNGNTKSVTISGAEFKGFILQGRGQGNFTNNHNAFIFVPCESGHPTVRHANAESKSSISLTWEGAGQVSFEGSVVTDWTTFYKLSA